MSKEAREVVTAMLEKNRSKRPSIEQVMDMAWFSEFSKKNNRGTASPKNNNNFANYALTKADEPKLQEEINLVKSMQEK